MDDAGPLLERDLVPGDHAMLDLSSGAEVVERASIAEADELLPWDDPRERLLGITRDGDPLAVLAQAVLRVLLDRGRDVGRQRPRCGRPDHERLAGVVEKREAHEERGVAPILVDTALRQLVLRERGPATRTPLGRAVAEIEPPSLVHELQEAPDVLDVRVAEREVVGSPVHPLTEADRALGQRLGRLHDHLPAAPREFRQPVLLDLALGVEPERALDPDLDPEPLAVEAVLVPLLVAAKRLVALEHVLQRPPPGRMDAEHHPVRRDGAVDEAEALAAAVLLPELLEGLLLLPELEDLELEAIVIRLVRER